MYLKYCHSGFKVSDYTIGFKHANIEGCGRALEPQQRVSLSKTSGLEFRLVKTVLGYDFYGEKLQFAAQINKYIQQPEVH